MSPPASHRSRGAVGIDAGPVDADIVEPERDNTDLALPHVTAVLVAHNGARWLPSTLAALALQTRKPDRRVAVDTGSTDETRALLTKAYGPTRVVPADRTSGFGAAVTLGVAHATGGARTAARSGERPAWIWVLHDDVAPEPNALEALLRYAASAPSATILGPKVLDWDNPRRLVEVGFRCDSSGRRDTGLELGEFDGGQHDAPRDVLAVGSAGMLIRREVWDSLGGFDPDLPLLRDDLDLCWRAALAGERVCVVPSAVVRHARAVSTGRRIAAAITVPPARADRVNAVYVVLANAGLLGFLLGAPRLAMGLVVRAVVFLLTRRPHLARDEVAALRMVLASPRRLLAARRRRAPARRLNSAAVRPLLAGRSHRLREYAQAGADLLAQLVGAGQGHLSDSRGLGVGGLESGPADDADDLSVDDARILRRLLTRPGLLLLLGLSLLAVAADRNLLGAGTLHGGRLLAAPPGAVDLWRGYADSWQSVGAGSPTPAAPWTPLLALLSSLLFGKPWLAVDVLTIGLVPLAGFAAWRSASGWISDVRIRVWFACTYALLPAVTGAVAAGRFDVGAVIVLAPGLVRAVARLLTAAPGTLTWRRAWATGLLLAIAAAFWPPVWVLAAVALLGGVVIAAFAGVEAGSAQSGTRTLDGWRGQAGSSFVVLGVPVALALPWWSAVFADPRLLLVGLGGAGGLAGVPASHAPGPIDILLGNPGGPGTGARWIFAPLVLAGLVALVRAERRRALAAWGLVLVGMAGALVTSRLAVGGGARSPYVGWGGAAMAVGALGLLAAVALSAGGARTRLAALPFGWRQPAAAVLAAAVAVVPVVAAGTWVWRGADRPVVRSSADRLPAFVEGDGTAMPGQQVLTLRSDGSSGRLMWALTRLGGPHLGDEDARPTAAAARVLDAVVADLASPRGTDAGEVLSTFGVRYVAVPAPGEPALLDALDLQPALSRVSYEGAVRLWRFIVPVNRLEVLAPPLAASALAPAPLAAGAGRGPTRRALRATPPTPISSGVEGAHAQLDPGPVGRLLVLAEPAGFGWRATLDGQVLRSTTAWGWAQAYVLPTSGGRLVVTHAAGMRQLTVAVQALLLLLVLVLAAPDLGRDSSDIQRPRGTLADEGDQP